ncbi:MAG TPA: penicillin acylase family protein, partial [Dehalococcoidia bacterium]|nr:penicillin acylase family protein [Dehalococcoidia bacterium]
RRIDADFGFAGEIPPVGPPSGQSNNWAVAGSRTTSGAPLLANDAHLRPSQPVVFYEIHLRGSGYEVAGATIPGFPGVLIGHNARIAWGVTVAFADTQDLIMQRVDPATPFRYEDPTGPREMARRDESIRVAGRRAPVEETVRLTDQGPILTPIRPGDDHYPLALRSTVLRPAHQMRALLALNRAGTWDAFRAALADWASPTLNFVYADVDGNIGYQLAGWIPRRRAGSQNLLPAAGWSLEDAWEGLLPFDELPSELNPPGGICATANNQVTPPDDALAISHEWTAPFRHDRVREVLSGHPAVTRGVSRELQTDTVSGVARDLIGLLEGLDLGSGPEAALDRLRAWDGDLRRRSSAAALYAVFRHHLILHWLAAPVPAHLRDQYLGRGVHPVLNPVNTFHVQFGAQILDRLRAARAAGWPAAAVETIRRSLGDTIAYLAERQGGDPDGWEWGRLHTVTFSHTLGDKPILRRLFNVGPSPIDGDSETVLQTGIDHWAPFAASGWSPSYRLIVDLGNFDRTLAVLPTGQSGHPFSRHYRDQHDLFLSGRYHPCPFSLEAVEKAAVARLDLVPPLETGVRTSRTGGGGP